MKKFVVLLFLVLLIFVGYGYYAVFIQPATSLKAEVEFFVYPGEDYMSFRDTLFQKAAIKQKFLFDALAKWKKLNKRLKAGRYVISPNFSLNQLINMFIAGRQTPIKIFIPPFRTLDDLLVKIDAKLLCGKDSLRKLLQDSSFCRQLGFTTENVRVLFLPLSHEVYWTTSCKDFLLRVKKAYDAFWNDKRLEKARDLSLKPEEVIILASIVDAETSRPDEMPKIAGVYINRLKKHMKLEADPTVIYALNDFTIKRVLKKHVEVESPYNTYKYAGLPPGPIRQPTLAAIEAVLNYEKHDYLFFCAREDFSGYHRFAKTASEHAINARKYQQVLQELLRKKNNASTAHK